MIGKIKAYFEGLKKKQEESKHLDNARKFYLFVNGGRAFIKFIQDDIKRQNNGMNRAQRRRFEHDLNVKGVLSQEIVNFYAGKVEWLISEIERREAAAKAPKQNYKITNPNVEVRNTPPQVDKPAVS